MASILSWAGKTAKKVEHGVKDAVVGTAKTAARTGQAVSQGIYNAEGKILGQPSLNANQLYGDINKTTGYTGTKKQIVGDLASNALLVAAPGVEKAAQAGITRLAPQIPKLIPKVAAGAVTGSAITGGTTAAQGGTKKDVAKAALLGAGLGAAVPAIGVGTPLVARKAVTAADNVVHPKFAGLPAHQVIMDTSKLDTLNNARQLLETNKGTAAQRNIVNQGLHQIKSDHGLDFISGSRADRNQRITQYLEQNGEAIPEYQQHLAKPSLVRDQSGAVGKNIRNTPEDNMTPIGEVIKQRAQIPTQDVQTPQVTGGPKVIQNRLTKGGKAGRQNIGPGTQELIQGEHTVRNTQALANRGQLAVDKLPTDEAINAANQKAAVKLGSLGEEDQTFIAKTIEKADMEANQALQAGDQVTYDRLRQQAADLHDALSEQGVKRGQANQALSILYKLSPQGLYYKAVRDIKKGGGEVTPELDAKLRSITDNVKNAADKETKNQHLSELGHTVANNVHQSALNQGLSIWKAALLSGVKTHTGNFLSNGTFGVLKGISDVPATAIDKLLSVGTGQRTKALGSLSAELKGVREGGRKGLQTLKTGIDTRNLDPKTGKYETHGELNTNNPIIQKAIFTPTNYVFRAMNAGDQPFYFAAFRKTLSDVAKADGINQGLRGSELSTHVKNLVDNPTEQMAATAREAAEKAVLGQDSKVAHALTQFTQKVPAAQVLVPFIKVPTNFLSRSLDYTPVGAIKEIVSQAKNKSLDQRALSEALGEATTGTAVLFLGAHLANQNLLSGQYPTDPKEQQRWKSEGITPNSIKVGGKWLSLNYLGPVGMLLGAGKDYHDAAAKGDSGTMNAIAGVGKNLTGQSFLSGFSGFANALNDPGRYGKNLINQEASSVVPSASNDIANLFDKNQRETNNPLQAAAARIPVARNKTLPVKQDVYGNELKQRTNPVDLTVDPLRPSNEVLNPVTSEVARLHNADPNNKDLQVTPTPVDKKLQIEGQGIKLTDGQRHDLQKQIGQATQTAWGQLINTPEYQSYSDTDKANALNKIRQYATENAERAYVVNNNLHAYQKPESTKAVEFAQGTPLAQLSAPTTKTDTTGYYKADDAEYKALKAKYDATVKTGGYASGAQKLKAEDALAKAQVGAGFSKDVRDLYGLSADQLYRYVSTNNDGTNLLNQVVAYGDALTGAGLQTKNKFRTTSGALSVAPKGAKAKSSGGSKSSGKKLATSSLPKLVSIPKTPKLKSKGFKVKGAKAPLLKTAKSKKLPSYAVKTPKVTKGPKAQV